MYNKYLSMIHSTMFADFEISQPLCFFEMTTLRVIPTERSDEGSLSRPL